MSVQERLFCIRKVYLINMFLRDNQSAVSSPSGLNRCLVLECILLLSGKQSRIKKSPKYQQTLGNVFGVVCSELRQENRCIQSIHSVCFFKITLLKNKNTVCCTSTVSFFY